MEANPDPASLSTVKLEFDRRQGWGVLMQCVGMQISKALWLSRPLGQWLSRSKSVSLVMMIKRLN